MNIISIDLPWKPDKRGRTALAVAGLDGNLEIVRASNNEELLQLVSDNAEQGSVILLDIPIEGCNQMGSKKFRPVGRALARQGIWIQPDSKAGNNGKILEKHIRGICRGKRLLSKRYIPMPYISSWPI